MDTNNSLNKPYPGVEEPHVKEVNPPSHPEAEKPLIVDEKEPSVPVNSPIPAGDAMDNFYASYYGISWSMQQRQKSPSKKLSGAAKKRVNWLVRQGKTYSEAVELANQPLLFKKIKEEHAKQEEQAKMQQNKANEVRSITAAVVPKQEIQVPMNTTPTTASSFIPHHQTETQCNNTVQAKPTNTEFFAQTSPEVMSVTPVSKEPEVLFLHQTNVQHNKVTEEISKTPAFHFQSSLAPPSTPEYNNAVENRPTIPVVNPQPLPPPQTSVVEHNTPTEVSSSLPTPPVMIFPQHVNVQNNEMNPTAVVPTQPSTSQQMIEQRSNRWINVFILHKDFPVSTLTEDQLKEVLDLILRNIVMQKEVKPRFHGTSFKPGHVIITCDNRETSEWLKSLESRLILKEGAEVKIVDEFNLPKPNVAIGSFHDCWEDSNEFILKLIGAQNGELKVDSWRVLRRTDEDRTHIVFSIDPASAKWLRDNGEVISFKFGETKLRVKGKNPFNMLVADMAWRTPIEN